MLNDDHKTPEPERRDDRISHNSHPETSHLQITNCRIPDPANTKQIGSYSLGAELGSGSFGKVVWAEHILTGVKVAIKILDKIKLAETPDDFELVKHEISNLKLVKHKNIAQLYEIIETPQHIFLVTELCEGKDLMDYILTRTKWSEEESLHFFQQLINALIYLHSQNIAHRDIKIDNLWLDKNKNLKWVDFGLSTVYKDNNLLNKPCGTIVYAAPEVLDGKEYHGMLADVWSSGIVLYGMIAGYLPFCNDDDEVNKINILEGQVEFPSNDFNELEKDILQHMLDKDPMSRFTLEDIANHPWFCQREFIIVPGIIFGYNLIPIDDKIMSLVEWYGEDKNKVKSDLERNRYTMGTAWYYILVQKVKNEGEACVSDLSSDEFIRFIANDDNLVPQYECEWYEIKRERDDPDKKDENINSTTVNNTSVNSVTGNESNLTKDIRSKHWKIVASSSTSDKKKENNEGGKEKENNKNVGNHKKQNVIRITSYYDITRKSTKPSCYVVQKNMIKATKKMELGRTHVKKHSNLLSKSVEFKDNKNSNNIDGGTRSFFDFLTEENENKQQKVSDLSCKYQVKPRDLSISACPSKEWQQQKLEHINHLNTSTYYSNTSLKTKPKNNRTSIPKANHPKPLNMKKEEEISKRENTKLNQRNKNKSQDSLISQLKLSIQLEDNIKVKKALGFKSKKIRNVDNSVINYRNQSPIPVRDFSYSPNHTGLWNKQTRLNRIPWKYKKQGLERNVQDNVIYQKYKEKIKNISKKRYVKHKEHKEHKEQSNINNTQNIKDIKNLEMKLKSNVKKITKKYNHQLTHTSSSSKQKRKVISSHCHKSINNNSQLVKINNMNFIDNLSKTEKKENKFFIKHRRVQSGLYKNDNTKLGTSAFNNVIINYNVNNTSVLNLSTSCLNCIDKSFTSNNWNNTQNNRNQNICVGFYEGPIDPLCISKYSSIMESIKNMKWKMKKNSIYYIQTKQNRFICMKNRQSLDIEIMKLNTFIDSDVLFYYKIVCKQGDKSTYRNFSKLLID